MNEQEKNVQKESGSDVQKNAPSGKHRVILTVLLVGIAAFFVFGYLVATRQAEQPAETSIPTETKKILY